MRNKIFRIKITNDKTINFILFESKKRHYIITFDSVSNEITGYEKYKKDEKAYGENNPYFLIYGDEE